MRDKLIHCWVGLSMEFLDNKKNKVTIDRLSTLFFKLSSWRRSQNESEAQQIFSTYVRKPQPIDFVLTLRVTPHCPFWGVRKTSHMFEWARNPQNQNWFATSIGKVFTFKWGKRDGKSISCHLVHLQKFLFLFFMSNPLKDGVLFDFFFRYRLHHMRALRLDPSRLQFIQ